MSQILRRVQTEIMQLIWGQELDRLPPGRRFLVETARLLYVLVRDLMDGNLNLRAMSLVYTTLLSMVPLLAVSFSVLKGFGVHTQIEPLLYNFLQPLGPKGEEVATQIVHFVDNVKVGVLGSVGLALLIYTVVSLLQKIERSFNYVWRVEQLRSLPERFSNYLSVVLIGPVLIFSAIGITASVMNNALVQRIISIEPFGTLFIELSRLAPYVIVSLAFTLIYIFIPNTRVKVRAALVGGLMAGILWQSTGWIFAAFIASSSKYTAIYSGFAILLLLLIWLYLSWLILLVGAQIAFYVQHPQYLTRTRVRLVLSNRVKEKLAMMVMYLVARSHRLNQPGWTLDRLAGELGLPGEAVQRVLGILVERGYLVETRADPPVYVPARDVDTVPLVELRNDLRSAEEVELLSRDQLPAIEPVDALEQTVEEAVRAALDGRTLGDLLGPLPVSVSQSDAAARPGGTGHAAPGSGSPSTAVRGG